MNAVLALFLASLRSMFQHKKALIMRASFMMINNFLYFIFWYFIFRKTDNLYGWTLHDIYRFLGLHMVFFGVSASVAIGWKDLKHLIDTGSMDVYLLRPIHPLIQAAFSKTDLAGIGDLIMGTALFFYTSTDIISDIPLFLYVSLVGGLAWFGAAFAIYALSFWKRANESILDLIYELTLAISGYPEHIVSKFVRFVAYFLLPIGLIVYLPIRCIRDPSALHLVALTAASAFLLLLAKVLFDAGVRRYESGSGWTVHT
jgi:ABC-2 type transport system permease protein